MNLATHKGDVDNGSVMIGQISGMLNEIKPVADIIGDIVAGLHPAIDQIHEDCK